MFPWGFIGPSSFCIYLFPSLPSWSSLTISPFPHSYHLYPAIHLSTTPRHTQTYIHTPMVPLSYPCVITLCSILTCKGLKLRTTGERDHCTVLLFSPFLLLVSTLCIFLILSHYISTQNKIEIRISLLNMMCNFIIEITDFLRIW